MEIHGIRSTIISTISINTEVENTLHSTSYYCVLCYCKSLNKTQPYNILPLNVVKNFHLFCIHAIPNIKTLKICYYSLLCSLYLALLFLKWYYEMNDSGPINLNRTNINELSKLKSFLETSVSLFKVPKNIQNPF
jgi:hypothetical protein